MWTLSYKVAEITLQLVDVEVLEDMEVERPELGGREGAGGGEGAFKGSSVLGQADIFTGQLHTSLLQHNDQ